MSWWGKLIGGTVGFTMGGPMGAMLGGYLGHRFVDKKIAGISLDQPVSLLSIPSYLSLGWREKRTATRVIRIFFLDLCQCVNIYMM